MNYTNIEAYKLCIEPYVFSSYDKINRKIIGGYGDIIMIINDEVLLKNWLTDPEGGFIRVTTTPDTIRLNPGIFDKII